MGSNPVVDLEQLLAPVSDGSPCGESLRWDPLYDEIKDARREGDKDALGADGAVQANWGLVSAKASAALAQRSKDLMLAGYLLEALVELQGFAGLRDGLRVISGLLEKFWDGLYPSIDGDDLEPRAGETAEAAKDRFGRSVFDALVTGEHLTPEGAAGLRLDLEGVPGEARCGRHAEEDHHPLVGGHAVCNGLRPVGGLGR